MEISDTLLKNRLNQLRIDAEESGLNALLIFSQGSRGSGSTHGYLRYLLNWNSWGSPSLLFFSVKDSPTLVVPVQSQVETAHDFLPWIDDIRFAEASDYGKVAQQLLVEGWIKGRVGTIGTRDLSYSVASDLKVSSQDWLLEDKDILLDKRIMIKDDIGITSMLEAAGIVDLMLEGLTQILRKPNIPAWKAQVEMEEIGRAKGAEHVTSWFVAGSHPDHTRMGRRENPLPIKEGDSVVVGIVIIYDGYYGHSLRMFSVGEPPKERMEVWKAARDAQNAAISKLKPGIGISVPNCVAEEVLFEHFPEIRENDIIRFRPCHFIGFDYFEYPSGKLRNLLNPPRPDEMTFQAGMTIEVHPNLRPKGPGFGAIGDIFLVTPNGCERLTKFPADLRIVEPL